MAPVSTPSPSPSLHPIRLHPTPPLFATPGGVSIPQSYTSFMAPVSTPKLHNDVKAYKDLEHMETPFVVRFHRCVGSLARV